ncbi:MAG: tetratricopeptide repeat protein, partial [Thermodesulfobacteria bacterium]|nr:tetratricopeptide repeat protein [Thermodesulfobacteriota bacterium]
LYRSLEIAEKFGDAHRAARSLVGIGDVRKYQGRYDVALDAYELAAKIYRGLGSREQAEMVEKAIASLREKLHSGEGSPQGGGEGDS